MASALADKIQVAVITATFTSAVWIVVGSVMLDLRPGEAAPEGDPLPPPTAQETFAGKAGAPAQDMVQISQPEARETDQLIVPVLEVRPTDLVDTYSDERGAGTRFHEAIDIMAAEGTSVVAAAPGTVERLFNSDVGGNTIYIRSTDRETIHYYAHLDEYAPGLQEGQQIRRGQRLGTVGSTGNASPDAPHLHFAILRTTPDAQWWEPATALNPYPLLTRTER